MNSTTRLSLFQRPPRILPMWGSKRPLPTQTNEHTAWSTSYTFDNVWYTPVAVCIEVRKIVVCYMDGSSFTDVNDLREIDVYAQGFHFRGDCQNS
jgi:hypothetical protein